MRTSQYVAYFLLSGISAILIVVGLATLEWRTYDTTFADYHYGLKKIKVTGTPGGISDGTYDIPETDDTKNYRAGADTALSMGIIALGCIGFNVVLVLLLKLCQGWTGGRSRVIAIIFSLAASILIIVGTVTYDQKLDSDFKDASKYGYSFGLYIAGGLLPFLIALALFVQKEIF